METVYRLFDKTLDYEQQRSLFRLSFPEAEGTSVFTNAHFDWKFDSLPSSRPSYQYVAAEPSCIVGYYAAIPFFYMMDGSPVSCGMVCDVMTHPDRRGKGIFAQIGRHATDQMKREGLGFTTGYPIRPEVIPGHLKVGWKKVQRLPVYLRVLGVRSFLPKPFRFLARAFDPFVSLLQACAVSNPSGYSTEVFERSEFLSRYSGDGEYTDLLSTWIHQQKHNALLKTCDFLRWRTGAPDTRYLFITLRHEERLVGLALARPAQMKGVDTLALLDFMVLDEHTQGCNALHEQLRRVALEHGKDAVACMCSSQSAEHYRFSRSAYLRSHLVFTLIVKKLDDRIPDAKLYSEDRWRPFWLDSDDL